MYLPPAISSSPYSPARPLATLIYLPLAPAVDAASASASASLPVAPGGGAAAEGLSEDGLQREEQSGEGGQRCGNRVILLPLEQGRGRGRDGGERRGERVVHDCCKKSHVNNLKVSFLLLLLLLRLTG